MAEAGPTRRASVLARREGPRWRAGRPMAVGRLGLNCGRFRGDAVVDGEAERLVGRERAGNDGFWRSTRGRLRIGKSSAALSRGRRRSLNLYQKAGCWAFERGWREGETLTLRVSTYRRSPWRFEVLRPAVLNGRMRGG